MVNDGIGEAARNRLRGSPHFAIRHLGRAHRDGVLTLQGRLPSYDLKPMALAMVTDVEGVAIVLNTIEVGPGPRPETECREERL